MPSCNIPRLRLSNQRLHNINLRTEEGMNRAFVALEKVDTTDFTEQGQMKDIKRV